MNSKQPLKCSLTATLIFIVGISLLCCFPSCKDDPFEYKIDRANAFSFKLDTFNLVTTDDVVFYMGPQVLHEFDSHTDGNAVGIHLTLYDPQECQHAYRG